jgi:ribosome maturation factor RimP
VLIEAVRKVVQDLVAPELKSLAVKLDDFERESKLRDEALAAKMDSGERLTHAKLEALSAKMDAQYQSLLYSLNLDKRVEVLERDKQSASA